MKNYEYTRLPGNPIITFGTGNAYNNSDVAAPFVFYDTPNNRWVCTYSAYNNTTTNIWTMALAYAAYDATKTYYGLEGPWTLEPTNPVQTPTPAEVDICCDSSIQVRNDSGTWTYYHYFMASVTTANLYLAKSTNLLTWTVQHSDTPLTPLGGDGVSVDPQLAKRTDDTFELWYAKGSYPRSSSVARGIDGLVFLEKTAFLEPPYADQNMGACDPHYFAGERRVLHDMADDALNPDARRIGEVMSLDGGRTWSGRRLRMGPTGAGWESVQVSDTSLVLIPPGSVRPTKFVLFYCGAPAAGAVQGFGDQIGIAVADYGAGVF